MLENIPVLAVMSENLGERGAHRVAYQDFLHLVEAPVASADVQSSSSPSKGTSCDGESCSSRWFRRLGYLAAGYAVTRIATTLLLGG